MTQLSPRYRRRARTGPPFESRPTGEEPDVETVLIAVACLLALLVTGMCFIQHDALRCVASHTEPVTRTKAVDGVETTVTTSEAVCDLYAPKK